MALDIQAKQFEFVCNTSTGTQQIASSLGFTPKSYIIISFYNTSNATFQQHGGFMIGMSDGVKQFVLSCISEDDPSSSDTGRAYSANVIEFVDPGSTSTSVAQAAHSSFGSGTITVNWTDASPTAYKCYGIAFGGTDLSVDVENYNFSSSSTGNQAFTGLAFQPVFGLFVSPGSTASIPDDQVDVAYSLGVAKSTSKRWLIANSSEDGQSTTDSWAFMSNGHCMGSLEEDSGAFRFLADFVSWDTNGFTLNITNNSGLSTSDNFWGMFFSAGNWDCGSFAKRTSTGSTVVSVDSTVDSIKGLGLFSNLRAISTTVIRDHNRISGGFASDASTEGGGWWGDEDANSDGVSVCRSEDANILVMADENATHGSSTLDAVANVTDMATADQFTIEYTTASSLVADVLYFCVGITASTLFQRSVNDSVVISDSITPKTIRPISDSLSIGDSILLKIIRPITDSLSIGDNITAMRSYFRTVSDSPSITDSIIPKTIRPISDSLNITDDITSLLRAIRTTSDSLSIGDSIILKIIRPISDSIVITDMISVVRYYFRTIVEGAISIGDSLNLKNIKPLSDSISIGDSITIIRYYFRSISDSLGITDSITKKPKLSMSDSLSISDTLTLKIIRPLSDTLSIDDNITRIANFFRSISDDLTITDSIILKIKRFVSDSLSIGDMITVIRYYFRSISDNLSIVDTLTLKVKRTISDTLGITDNITPKPKRTVSDSLTINDSILLKVKRFISDSITIDDNIVAQKITNAIQRSVSDSIAITDDLIRTNGLYFRSISDSLNIGDNITKIKKLIRSVSDSLSITDSIPFIRIVVAGAGTARHYIGHQLRSLIRRRHGI